MRDARQQREWLYIGRIRSDLRDQRLKMTAMTIATSLSAKVLSQDAVLSCVIGRARLGTRFRSALWVASTWGRR